MKHLIEVAARAGWSGLEHYVGIPSTVGAALWQNLHFLSRRPSASGPSSSRRCSSRAISCFEDGSRATVARPFMRFGYDTSVLHERELIVLSATLRLTSGDESAMQKVMQENLAWRGARHPWLEWPRCSRGPLRCLSWLD